MPRFAQIETVFFGTIHCITYNDCPENGSDDLGSADKYCIISTLPINPFVHKHLTRYHPNPFRDFPCTTIQIVRMKIFFIEF